MFKTKKKIITSVKCDNIFWGLFIMSTPEERLWLWAVPFGGDSIFEFFFPRTVLKQLF